jgi:hypothetical protein
LQQQRDVVGVGIADRALRPADLAAMSAVTARSDRRMRKLMRGLPSGSGLSFLWSVVVVVVVVVTGSPWLGGRLRLY